MSQVLDSMKADIEKDEKMVLVKKRILKQLKELPDDESRRRVIGAVAVMLGFADATLRPPKTLFADHVES